MGERMADAQDIVTRALTLHQAGRLSDAEPLYRAALGRAPHTAGLRHMLGILRHQSGDTPGGIRLVRQALVMAPADPAAAANLVTLLLDAGALSSAARQGHRAVALAPGATDATVNLAAAEVASGRPADAARRLTALVARTPAVPALLDRLATAEEAARLWDAAERTRRRAACAAPDQAEGYRALASQLAIRGREAAARPMLARADRLVPSFATRFQMALMVDRVPSTEADIGAARERLERFLDAAEQAERLPHVADPHRMIGTTNFGFSYQGLNDRSLFERVARLMLRISPELGWTAPHCQRPAAPGRRIRVAVASAYFGRHTIGKLYGQILRRLPRDRFEVVAVARPQSDDSAFALQTGWADAVVLLTGDLSHDRRRIAEIEADALFYLDIGMDPLTYYLAYARLAPVQFTTWGHPDTTGIPNVDHFLTAASAEPSDWRDHYSERALLLPETPICYPRVPEIRHGSWSRPAGIPDRARLYACPQTLFKLHPCHDALYGELLRRDPSGHLVFIESAAPTETARVRARFDAACPDVAERIHVVPRMGGATYLSFLRDCDVLLDCPAFSGGNSTFEALAMGSPMVPYNGPFVRMRITDSILRTIGIDAAAPSNAEDYLQRAIALAEDPTEFRAAIAACGPAAFERDSAIQHLSGAIERMVDAARHGEHLAAGVMS